MAIKFFRYLPFTMMIAMSATVHAASVSETDDASLLVDTILAGDVEVKDLQFSGRFGSAGIYSGGSDVLGADRWVLLSTGWATSATTQNQLDENVSQSFASAGDSELEEYLNDLFPTKEYSTYDAVSLEFKFKTSSGNVEFEYIFASEEYPEFVGREFNDAFALFIDDENVAVLPDSDEVVSINTVNDGSNADYFVSNLVETEGADSDLPIVYDGLTTTLTAKKTDLAVDEWHTMKFVIADINDANWDSAVFIKANSFRVGEPPVRDHIGEEFLFAYMPNSTNSTNSLKAELYLTSAVETTVEIRYP